MGNCHKLIFFIPIQLCRTVNLNLHRIQWRGRRIRKMLNTITKQYLIIKNVSLKFRYHMSTIL